MFLSRVGSFNALEQLRDRRSLRKWLGAPLPCADELAYVSERISLEDLRFCQGQIYDRLKRNKALGPNRGWMLAAIDGHEINSSYCRCCEKCLKRPIETGGRTRIQYYHRVVVFQILSPGFEFLLDLEPVEPGEDEPAAAARLLGRVLENHPRCFDVLSADAIYLRPSMLNLLHDHNKYLIAVLKANQPELLLEARTLMGGEQPQILSESLAGSGVKSVELRDMAGFETDSIRRPLRVVWAAETTTRRRRIANKWHKQTTSSDWLWATNLPAQLASAEMIATFGHLRWQIENEGFNELVTHWHADHYYHHHPNSIVALWLMLFMAHAVFHCFYRRNLKDRARQGKSVIYFAALMATELRGPLRWWPPPPG